MREGGPSAKDMGVESASEAEFNRFGQEAHAALQELIVSKGASPEDLREAFNDAVVIERAVDLVISDTKGTLSVDAVQEEINPLIKKHGLNPEKFNLTRLEELGRGVSAERGL